VNNVAGAELGFVLGLPGSSKEKRAASAYLTINPLAGLGLRVFYPHSLPFVQTHAYLVVPYFVVPSLARIFPFPLFSSFHLKVPSKFILSDFIDKYECNLDV
jgi:hypothetical protein